MTAILELHNNDTYIDLINISEGIHLRDWTPKIAQYKGGGIYQSSSLADGRRLVSKKFDTVTETFDLKVNDLNQDQLILEIQDLLRMLEQATSYWTSDWQDELIYLKVKADCETNPRYAIVKGYSLPDLDNPFGQPFLQPKGAVFDNITLNIERGHWQSDIPGNSDCVQVSSQISWNPRPAWTVLSTDPVGTVTSITQAPNGDLYLVDIGGTDTIKKSTNNGVNWSTVYTAGVGDTLRFVLAQSNGFIYFSSTDGNLYRSVNAGSSWQSVDAVSPSAMIELANGALITFTSTFRRSTDLGNTWTEVLADGAALIGVIQLANGKIIGMAQAALKKVFSSTDNGTTWNTYTLPIDINEVIRGIYLHDDDNIFVGAVDTIYISRDSGLTFAPIYVNASIDIYAFCLGDDGIIYAVSNTDIYISEDDGKTWALETATPTNAQAIITMASGTVLSGDNGQVLSFDYDTNFPVTLGDAASCDADEIFITNSFREGNVTNIKISDGGVFSDIYPMTSFPTDLLPAAIADGDFLYIGISSAYNPYNPFSNVVFELEDRNLADNYLLLYTYSSGFASATVAIQLGGGVNPRLNNVGKLVVTWRQATDFAVATIDSVEAYWLRIAVNSLSGSSGPPGQVNHQIFTVTNPYFEIAAAQILGDIPGLIRLKLHNVSDQDGPAGTNDLYANRAILGLRSYSRGDRFNAYINLSDRNTPAGITLTLGTNVAHADDGSTSTGRRTTYNPTGVEAMGDRITVTLARDLANQYYGSFHCFLRGRRTGGNASDFDVQLRVQTGSGGVIFTSQNKQFQGTTAWELIDFGEIEIPASGAFKRSTDFGDVCNLIIRASADDAAIDLYLYDLILIPTDEWAGDFWDGANESDSDLGRSGDIQKQIDIDSVLDQKNQIKALIRTADNNESITSVYIPVTNDAALLQANERQRIWFLSARTSATGTSYNWLSEPWAVYSVKVEGVSRYLGMRGNR